MASKHHGPGPHKRMPFEPAKTELIHEPAIPFGKTEQSAGGLQIMVEHPDNIKLAELVSQAMVLAGMHAHEVLTNPGEFRSIEDVIQADLEAEDRADGLFEEEEAEERYWREEVDDLLEHGYVEASKHPHLIREFFEMGIEESDATQAIAFEFPDLIETENPAEEDTTFAEFVVLASAGPSTPLAFAVQPDTEATPDPFKKALMSLSYLKPKPTLRVTDRGLEFQEDLADVLRGKQPVVTEVNTEYPWVQKELAAHFDELNDMFNQIEMDRNVRATTVRLTLDLDELAGNPKKKAGTPHTRQVYLHLYRNVDEQNMSEMLLVHEVCNMQEMLELDAGLDYFPTDIIERHGLEEYLSVNRATGEVTINKEACYRDCKYAGCMALISTDEHYDAEEAYRVYQTYHRMRRFIDPDVVDPNVLTGELFLYFVAYVYWDSVFRECDEDAKQTAYQIIMSIQSIASSEDFDPDALFEDFDELALFEDADPED